MAVATPQHSFGLTLHYLRELLADSVCWQAMCLTPEATYDALLDTIAISPSVLNRTTAKQRIAVGVFPTDQEGCDTVLDVPRLLIRYEPDGTFSREEGPFRRSQSVLILIEYPVPPAWRSYDTDSFSNQELDGQDKIGRILTDCNAVIQAGTAERLQVESWTFGPHGLIHPAESNGQWVRTAEIHAEFVGVCS